MVPASAGISVVSTAATVVSDDDPSDPHADKSRTEAAAIAVMVFFMVSLL
jgi:hypothetical protein